MSPGPLPDQPPNPAIVVDARGMRCPWPVLRLARALRDEAGRDGAVAADLLTDDPAAAGEVAAFAAGRGLVVAPIAGGWRVMPGP
jgi:tRNA 2-thiouridine synthesizing protein A